MSAPSPSLRQLCLHTYTHRPLPIEDALRYYGQHGIGGVSIWRESMAGRDSAEIARRCADLGIEVVSFVRGGFLASADPGKRREALDDNRRVIDQAHALGAPLIVLVCGADPSQGIDTSRAQIQEGIEAILPHAEQAGIRLGIEPLHPMYAADRSAINTLAQSNDLCERLDHPQLGIVADVYHIWWEPGLEYQIRRAGEAGRIFAFHLCDWKPHTEHLLLDRGLMGEGCIPLRQIHDWVRRSGFTGFDEVEIFSRHYWSMDQRHFLQAIIESYHQLLEPASRGDSRP